MRAASVHGPRAGGSGTRQVRRNHRRDDCALKYGSGVPFYRLEKLQASLWIPLPAATQWEIVEEVAEMSKPALEELIRQAAPGEVLHNHDTSMRVLRLPREPSDKRTGVFTSGIVATSEGRKIALYFTGAQHAGENLGAVLRQRAVELSPPIQMSDALSRNVPKLASGVEILIANCLAHGRRQFVDTVQNFPAECRYVLEILGRVYGFEAEVRRELIQPHQNLSRSRWNLEHAVVPLIAQTHERTGMPIFSRRSLPLSPD